jgi:hypothetical protein
MQPCLENQGSYAHGCSVFKWNDTEYRMNLARRNAKPAGTKEHGTSDKEQIHNFLRDRG